ncbi:MAG TPA: TolC family protein [Vicinamibacterales bacterium]|jgi:cobalt-zinc-cadmium efflux system outer membrane protein
MRTLTVPCICLIAYVSFSGTARAQAGDIPSRLSLADALALAEQRNPALASARQQAAIADAGAIAARQWLNPVFNLAGAKYRPGEPTGTSFLNQQELSVQIEQQLETAGRRRWRSAVAAAAQGASRSGIEDQRRQLRLEVQRAYFQLVLARLDADAAATSLADIDKVIALNRSRYQQGEISGGELRRLEVERLKFTDDVLAAELESRHARSAVLALLGARRLDLPIEPSDGLVASDGTAAGLPAGSGTSLDVEAIAAQALSGRPDLVSARQDQSRSRAELGLQRAIRTPNVSVGAGLLRDFGVNGLMWNVTVPLTLFDRNLAGITRAEAEARLADSRVRERELAVSLDVQQAVDLVEISRRRVEYLEREYVKKAREARDAVLAAYRSGETPLLDFLDAQRVYRDVLRAYNRALFDHRLSLIQLEAAVGTAPGGPHS